MHAGRGAQAQRGNGRQCSFCPVGFLNVFTLAHPGALLQKKLYFAIEKGAAGAPCICAGGTFVQNSSLQGSGAVVHPAAPPVHNHPLRYSVAAVCQSVLPAVAHTQPTAPAALQPSCTESIQAWNFALEWIAAGAVPVCVGGMFSCP